MATALSSYTLTNRDACYDKDIVLFGLGVFLNNLSELVVVSFKCCFVFPLYIPGMVNGIAHCL